MNDLTDIINKLKNENPREAHVAVPRGQLGAYEAAGFSTDGVVYEKDGETWVNMQKSFVFDEAETLTFDPECSAVLTRTVFSAPNVKKAVLSITALGYFIPYFNGEPLTEDRLIPPKSDYAARDLSTCAYPIYDTMSHRIYYYEYDLTNRIRAGENLLAVHIGAGWFADNKNPAERMPRWGENLLIFTLRMTDENGNESTVCSTTQNTKWKRSYVRETSLYYGEYHDYNRYDPCWNQPGEPEGVWHTPNTAKKPLSFFQLADFPADRDCGEITPKLISQYAGRKLYDLGQVAAGVPVIKAGDPNRTNLRILLRYGDKLNEDGSFALRHTGGDWREQTDCFLLTPKAAGTTVRPAFLWHASRYIELTGCGELVSFIKMHTPLTQVGFFESDNETLNWLFNAYINTQTANLHGSIPSDCPHRERLGYTGDGQLCCGAAMQTFDMRQVYKKWMRDIRDCQDIYNGHVQHTAPFFGGGGGPGGWGGAAVLVPWRYYKQYNDISALKDAYRSMKAYIGYMTAHCEDGLVTHGEKDGWCLGDWCPPHNKIEIPNPYVNTYFLVKCAGICEQTAELLNEPADKAYFAEVRTNASAALTAAYFDDATGSFCGGVQGADAFAVDVGLGDERTKRNLIEKYAALGEFDTGIFGTDLTVKVLFELGEGALAFRLLTNETENSFYNMKRGGTNTLWENWDGCDSLCHPMFGAVIEYLFRDILGIRRYHDAPGFADVVIKPADIPELKHLKGSFCAPEGKIEVELTTDADGARHVRYQTDAGVRVHEA